MIENSDNKKGILKRIKEEVLGKNEPKLYIKIIFNISIVITTLYLILSILGLTSVFFIDFMETSIWLKNLFSKIGLNYDINNTFYQFKNKIIIYLILLTLAIVGLILIWRNKIIGYYIYLISYLSLIISIPIIYSLNYLKNEYSLWQIIVFFIATLPVLILLIIKLIHQKKESIEQ